MKEDVTLFGVGRLFHRSPISDGIFTVSGVILLLTRRRTRSNGVLQFPCSPQEILYVVFHPRLFVIVVLCPTQYGKVGDGIPFKG